MARSKRTYNVSETTQRHVRELTSEYRVGPTQDAVIELAVERLYRDALERTEAARWAEAAADPEFRAEVEGLARAFDAETWPT
jgi:hypothetical protein